MEITLKDISSKSQVDNLEVDNLEKQNSENLKPTSIAIHEELREKLTKEKYELLEIHSKLEEVRLSLHDSGGQGYLMNASATIASYIRNTY